MPEQVAGSAKALETRWPCPVCVGVSMEKKHIDGPGRGLTLDFCPRCGGLWFDRGEVGEFARRDRTAMRGLIIDPAVRLNPPCHGCQAPLDRNLEKCPACGHANVIACPVCDRAMERRETDGLILDICKHCQGVWFDNAELTAIWRLNLKAATEKRRRGGGDGFDTGGDILLGAMFWNPGLVVYGGHAAAEVVGSVAGAAAEASASVFETIFEIISGLFDG
ncbi:MAG: zf-TFIIB domain-containing protein [Gemmatimonadaceae bacterium]